MNIKETKKRGKFRRFGAFVLALSMIFGSATPAIAVAAETPTVVEEHAEKPAAKPAEAAKEATAKTETEAPAKAAEPVPAQAEQTPAKTEEKPAVETQAAPAKAQKNAPAEDGLEISPEVAPEGVRRAKPVRKPTKPPTPTFDPKPAIGESTVQGAGLVKSGQRGAFKELSIIITVTVKRQAGDEETQTCSLAYSDKGNTWSVTFSKPLEAGDTLSAVQTFGEGNNSEKATYTVTQLLKEEYKDKLKMPVGEIWVENKSSSLVNDDEQADAFELLKKANPDIVNDIQSAKFEIGAADQRAYFTVTYTDNSVSEKICATELTVQQVTETSRGFILDPLNVVSQTISGKVVGDGSFDGVKIELVINVNKAKMGDYCTEKKCTLDKDSSNPIMIPVNPDGSFSYTLKSEDPWNLHQVVGVAVKEPRKFKNCNTETLKLADPAVTEVRDPRKYTDKDKQAIDKAIREANTRNGVSKLPAGTGFPGIQGMPAIIDFDKNGNARIISPNNVEVDHWDTSSGDRKPVFAKNGDGTYKVKPDKESEVITIPAEKLVRNLGPEATTFAVQPSAGTVTVTPPKYTASGDDTDLAQYTLTYHDAQGNTKTITAKRDIETNKWSGDGVNETDGTITLKVDDLALGDTFKTVTKDKGGIAEGDTEPKTTDKNHSVPKATLTFEKGDVNASKSMDAKEVNQGGKFTLPENGFERPPYKKFKGWSVNGTPKKPKDELDHVESDTTITAVWEPIMVKVTYKADGGSGKMDGLQNNAETVEAGTFYKFKPNTFVAPAHKEFDTWSIGGTRVTAEGVQLEEADIIVTALWKWKKVKVTYAHGEGSGDMTGLTGNAEEADESQSYTPRENSFTAPENKKFDFWKADVWQQDQSEALRKDPGKAFDIYKDTTLTAQWTFIEVKITYDPGEHGSGASVPKKASQNQDYVIENVSFTPETNYKFIGWKADGDDTKLYQTDETINAKTGRTLTAQWELMERTITVDPGRGTGTPYDKTMIVGQEFELPQPSPRFQAPENEEFSHWKVGNDTKEYKVGEKFEVKDNVTVTAQWKPIMWDLIVDPGTEGAGQKTTDKIEQGTKYRVPQSNTVQAKEPEKYEFSHWTVNGEKKDPGTEIVIKGKTEVVAHWKIQKKTVTYENGGGHGVMDPVTRDYGTRFTLPQPAFEAPNENQEFSHWEITGDNEPRQPGYAFDLTKNITVKAVWKDSAFTVTYEPGLVGSGTKAPVTVLKKAPTHELAAADTFRPYDGFEFAGWEIDGKSYEPGFAYTVTKNTTVTAKWRPKTIQITFVSGVGSDDANIEKRTTQGGSYYLPNSEFKAKEGYQFRGWEINGAEKKVGDSVNTDHDVTITALWDKLVKVHYDANGGDWSGLRRKTESVPENKPFQLSYAPKQDGYVFDGWQAQGERKMYARATHPGTATEMTFVAQWRERGTSGGSGNTPGVPPVIPGTEPGTPPVTPGTEPSTPPVTPGTEPSTPSVPSDGGIPDRDALLRRLKSLWNSSEMRRLLEQGVKKGQNGTAIPRAGVGIAERTASTVLFPVDLMPAKKREDD